MSVANLSTSQLRSELEKRTEAEQLQARMQPKIDAENKKHLEMLRKVIESHCGTPVAEWPEKAVEQCGVACRELCINTPTLDAILKEAKHIKANSPMLEGWHEKRKAMWDVVVKEAEALRAAEAALREQRVKHSTATHERSNFVQTCAQLENDIKALWILNAPIDEAVSLYRGLERANNGDVKLPITQRG